MGGENSLELLVKMIYNGNEGDIVNQYIAFCKVFNRQIAVHRDDGHAAIMETLKLCRDGSFLAEFLEEHSSEVYTIMFDYINNAELLMDIHVQSEKRIAVNESKIEIARKMLADGMAADAVAKYTGLTMDELSRLQNESATTP